MDKVGSSIIAAGKRAVERMKGKSLAPATQEPAGLRCPVVLCLDGSASMQGDPIRELNAGLRQFLDEVRRTPRLKETVELGIVRFAQTVQVVRPMSLLGEENIQPIAAEGGTPLGEALHTGLAMIDRCQRSYRAMRSDTQMPWLVIMTDGQPSDEWKTQAWRVKSLAGLRQIAVLAIGIGSAADMRMLAELCSKDLLPKRLQGLRFADFFTWLRESLALSAGVKPGQRLALPSPARWSK